MLRNHSAHQMIEYTERVIHHYAATYLSAHPIEEQQTPTACYIICASPRSGSQLLVHLLTDSHLAGHPAEFFSPWNMGHAKYSFPKDLIYDRAYVNRLIAKYAGANGVFGVKAHFLQVTNFVGLTRLASLFPTELHYISLSRDDDVQQAVSLARAIQTRQWSSDQPVRREPVYDHYQIQSCLQEIRTQKKGWETHFTECGIEPYRVEYKEMVADRERVVRGILKYLNVTVPNDFQLPEPKVQKQADHVNDEWAEAFRERGYQFR